ncbi:MAG: DUF6647 family protein [Pseudomonadota bacterium]
MAYVIRFCALLWCALLMLVLVTRPAAASQPDLLEWRDAKSLTALIHHLEEWLDRNTELPRASNTPNVRQIGLVNAAHLHAPIHSSQQSTTRGLYDPHEATIYLVRPWDRRNPFDVAVLLHELVHHRQREHGHWYCPGAQELPAYRIQDKWLAELGLEADINWIAVVLEAGCTPRDIHPD